MDLFISDVHLGGQEPAWEDEKSRILSEVIRRSGAGDRLLLLGDIFDVWIGWNRVVPAGFHRTLTALEDASDRGVEMHFLAGNHDFHESATLGPAIGLHFHREAFRLECGDLGRHVMLSHGDEPAGSNPSYRLLHSLIRARPLVTLGRCLPPDLLLQWTQAWSRTSRRQHVEREGSEYWYRQYRERVVRKWWSSGARFVICGHHHCASIEESPEGVLVNLGHWLSRPTFGIREGSSFELRQWTKHGDTVLDRASLTAKPPP